MPKVKFLPGDGTTHELEVRHIATFARDQEGQCAFCHGDPCAEFEETPPDAPIRQYYRNAPHAETCPFCQGAPS